MVVATITDNYDEKTDDRKHCVIIYQNLTYMFTFLSYKKLMHIDYFSVIFKNLQVCKKAI